MRVLVTGADGYIGAILGPLLRVRGHQVDGLDCGFYRSGRLYDDGLVRPDSTVKDIRHVALRDVVGYDAVVHLAELSNDPLCEHDPRTTFAINHEGSVALAQTCREAGVPRFVYTSSCSVYGAGSDAPRTEESATDPQTAYARCKVLVERDVVALACDSFTPVFLRNATAFGPSPRMRFDIVLNNLAGIAWTSREIRMTSDGSPWRPLVHVADIAEAIIAVLEAPRAAVHGEILNVGSDAQNYRVREIAEIVARIFPGCSTSFGRSNGDNRSYRVSFAKIRERLPGFACRWSAEDGARQLRAVFERIGLTRAMFEEPAFTRLQQLKLLLSTHRIDGDLFWRTLEVA